MARIGAFCFPGTGHINPMTALSRRLQQRGHEVVIFGIADMEAKVRAAGVEFSLIGERDYPLGTLQELDQRLGELSGLKTFKFTVERVKNTAIMVLRDGPGAARRANVDCMLVDEADMGGNVADYLGLPFHCVFSAACGGRPDSALLLWLGWWRRMGEPVTESPGHAAAVSHRISNIGGGE